jgi:DNA mismatch endonuclease (patch repair protein)
MASVLAKNTRPEITVRTSLWAMGYRYRVHVSTVFGAPDIVFHGLRVAVFIDGDFWHGNREEWRRRGRKTLAEMFPTRTAWWVAKIRRNIARDRAVNRRLSDEGWRVLRVWESAIVRNPDAAIRRIVRTLETQGRRLGRQREMLFESRS